MELYFVILAPAAPVAFFVILAPAAPVAFFVILAPAAPVAFPCAFAALTVYKATVTTAANKIAAVMTNDSCFCIRTLTTKYYI